MSNTQNLRRADIPPPKADLNSIIEFAHTMDGYEWAGSFEKCAEIAKSPNEDSIDELRAALFFFFRSMRHSGEPATKDDIRYIHRTLDRLRRILDSAEPKDAP